jgi:hypothetical protein
MTTAQIVRRIPKVFLCLLSLHQQRKKVGCGDEIPAYAPRRTRKARANA